MKTFFKIAAVFDWITGLGLIVNPHFLFQLFQLPPPNYPGIFIMLGGIVLVFGWVFWQVSRDPSNRPLFQMAILAKVSGFAGLSLAVLLHQLPPIVFIVGLIGDGLWLPPFIYFYRREHVFHPKVQS